MLPAHADGQAGHGTLGATARRQLKIIFVNRFFHPDLAPTGRYASEVAFDLAAAGHEVHAVTSRLAYDGNGPGYAPLERVHGVIVHRVWTTRFGRSTLAGRALDYATFYFSAFLKLAVTARPGTVIVAKTDPPLLSVPAALAAWLKGAQLVNWLQDIFPEVAERAGMRAGPLGGLARRLRDWSVRRAARNAVLGERMAQELRRLVPRAQISIAPNWADGDAIRPAPRHGGEFVIGYAGNFGRVHEFETVLAAARALAGERQLAWLFTGGGHHFARLADASLPNVTLRGYVPQEQLADNLAAADVHLVTLLPALEGLVMPSKFYGVAAAGRPVIFVGDPDGEIARLVRRHDIGLTVQPGDVAGLVAAIRSLRADAARCRAMGERVRRVFEAEWDKPIALARWRTLIEALSA